MIVTDLLTSLNNDYSESFTLYSEADSADECSGRTRLQTSIFPNTKGIGPGSHLVSLPVLGILKKFMSAIQVSVLPVPPVSTAVSNTLTLNKATPGKHLLRELAS